MFEIEIIESGYIMADGGAMFGAIPKRAWKHKYSCDEQNRCKLAMRCILAVSHNKRILVDLGMGNKHIDRVSYYQPHELVDIEKAINTLGYSASDITDVVLTHLHFDHCGYATKYNNKGKLIPSFPKANYWLSARQWENSLHANPLEEDSIFTDNIRPIHDAGLLHLVSNNTDLCDGFSIRLFDGHSEGQLVPYIHTQNGVTTFPGDLIPTAAHVALEWISAYDISALTSYREKERFLLEAVKCDYNLIYCHDSNIIQSGVKQLNNNFIACNKIKKDEI